METTTAQTNLFDTDTTYRIEGNVGQWSFTRIGRRRSTGEKVYEFVHQTRVERLMLTEKQASKWVAKRTPTKRRTAEQIIADRSNLLASFSTDWERSDGNRTDLAALVRTGELEVNTRVEYDRQPGNGSQFGGAAVVQRRRNYYRKATR